MGRRCVCLALAVVAGQLSCQRDDDKNKRRRDLVAVAKPAPPVSILSETVLTRGAEPHQLLRYRQEPGVREHRRTAVAEIAEIENRQPKPTRRLSPVTTRFSTTWRAGAALLDVATKPPEIGRGEPAAVRDAREQIARFETLVAGTRATLEVSDRGVIGAVGGLSSEDARRELAAALVDSIAVLPEVPIGPGAKWRVVRAIPRARTAVKQQITYTLVSVTGSRLVLEVDMLTVGERQPISLPAAVGATSELLALRVSQRGEIEVDLAMPTIRRGELERSDIVHLRTTRQQKTLQDYFASSQSTVTLATE